METFSAASSVTAGPSRLDKADGAQAPASELRAPPTPSLDDLPTFASISHLLSAPILLALSHLRFSHPTPVQSQVLPLALSGHDIVARARTGSGKTLAYGLPTVQKILTTKSALGKANAEYQQVRGLVLVPTKELAEQVTAHLAEICQGSDQDIRVVNLARDASSSVHNLLLADRPDIVIATPSKVSTFLQSGSLSLQHICSLVLDEADLLLSYGHDSSVRSLFSGGHLPKSYQSFLMSATMSQDVEELRDLLSAGGRKAQVLNIQDPTHHANLTQYYVQLPEESKFLLLYVLLKLRLVCGKILIFVNDVDRGFKARLFLETFGIRSCVLNAEMPANSRYHVVQEFNKGVYDVIIATDESERGVIEDIEDLDGGRGTAQNDANAQVDGDEDYDENTIESQTKRKRVQEDSTVSKKDHSSGRAGREYGVSRGIDFVSVTCVINFDLPTSVASYIHRIGRTARAHTTGIALSFVVPASKNPNRIGVAKSSSSPTAHLDASTWRKISRQQSALGATLHPWTISWPLLESFRYRTEDALRATTRARVKEARIKELKQELLRSERLRAHFEDNPRDWEYLRHDRELSSKGTRQGMNHLKHVPAYLLPGGGRGGLKAPRPIGHSGDSLKVSYDENGRSLGYVGLKKQQRGGRGGSRAGRGGRGGARAGFGTRGKKKDPLRTGAK